ncbi:MAG: PAS domain S-box protein [Candidatus Thermoplasmatota archaeon]
MAIREDHEEMLDNFDEIVILLNRDMEILFVNKAIEKVSKGKIKRKNITGKNFFDVFPSLKEDFKAFDKKIKIRKFIPLNGEIFAEINKIPVKEKKKTKQILITIRDISYFKKIEENLREMIDKYSKIVELAREGICIDDENEKMIFVNEAFANILGYKKNELIGKDISCFVDEEGKKILEKQVALRRKGKSSRYEIKVYRKDGKQRHLLISASPLFIDGKYKGSVSVNLDITERKNIEEKLKREREQLFSILEGIDEPIYISDPNTYEILFVNKIIKKFFGKNIIGKKCYKVFQNLDKSCDFCTNDKIFGKNFGKTYIWEWKNLVTGRWYKCIDKGIRWIDGREARLEIAIDITERKVAEEILKDALEKEREFKLKTAHYFFNPTTIAKGYINLVIEEIENDKKVKLEKAINAIERIEKVVKNIISSGEVKE